MSTDDRFSEDKDKRLHRMKSSADDGSKALSNSDILKPIDIPQRTGPKAYSIKYATKNKFCSSIRIEQRQLKVGQTEFYSLIDDLYKQLDGKEIQDSKDHLWINKYRERAKVFMLDIYEVGCAKFHIDHSDLHDKADSLLSDLDEDAREYVMREVICRIFASIGVPHFRLTQKYCVF